MRSFGFVGIVTLLAMIFLGVPLVMLVIQSLTNDSFLQFPPQSFGVRWYEYVAQQEDWRLAAGRSLLVAFIVTPLAVVFGTMAAFGLDRGPAAGRRAIYSFLIAPLILPHLVLALGMLRLALVVGLEDTTFSLVMGLLTIALPYVVITVGASLSTLDRTQEEAAQSLGANGWQVFWNVVLPGIRPGILAGFIFAFITSFDEFIVSYFLVTFQFTLPLQIFSSLSFQVDPSIAAVSTIALALSALLTAIILSKGQVVSGGKAIK